MNNEQQQTAVELFAIALYEGGYLQGNGDEINDLLERHKEMEKYQIIEARADGNKNTKCDCVLNGLRSGRLYMNKSNQTYYDETYGGNK